MRRISFAVILFQWNRSCLSENPGRIDSSLHQPPLELCEENMIQVIGEMRTDLGTNFGYDPRNDEIGITGKVEFVELDGPPSVVIALSGRF